jgi:hypothetical protein
MRADVIIPEDSSESQELIEAIRRRLLPEVLKGFGFRVSRMEHFRVGCYDSASGGYFAPHRDNTTPLTKHRRYALTLNLNTGDYEGGLLRFPEYGPQLYAPPAGGAVVFHCSQLGAVQLTGQILLGRRGSRSQATTRSIMSRSVKMPARRPSSVIRTAPTLQSRMAQAAA